MQTPIMNNFKDFETNRKMERDSSLQEGAFRESVFRAPLGSGRVVDTEYTAFQELPGVGQQSIGRFNSATFKHKTLNTEITWKHWAALALCSISSACVGPFMICMPQPICYKLFWIFFLV